MKIPFGGRIVFRIDSTSLFEPELVWDEVLESADDLAEAASKVATNGFLYFTKEKEIALGWSFIFWDLISQFRQ